MTPLNPSPLANPFSERIYGNFNINKALRGGYFSTIKRGHGRHLRVPNQDIGPFDPNARCQNDLHTPNQDTPDGDGSTAFNGNGFIGNSPFFKCMDGTVIDTRTRKIVEDPNAAFKAAGYWGNPNQKREEEEPQWEQTPSIEQIMRSTESSLVGDATLSQRDIEYWAMARAEAANAMANLNDGQKKLMDFANTMFPPSRFVDESKKTVQSNQTKGQKLL